MSTTNTSGDHEPPIDDNPLGIRRWKQIKDFPMYWVSDDNRVFNMSRLQEVSRYVNNHGQLCVRIYRKKHGKVWGTSRAVNKLRREAFNVEE